MLTWKKSLLSAILLNFIHIPLLFIFSRGNGMGLLIYLVLILPLVSFWSGLILCHRKGSLPTFPILYGIIFYLICYLFFLVLELMSYGYQASDWVSFLPYFLLALIPSLLGSVLGGLAHKNGWLKQPFLLPAICLATFLIGIFTSNAYPYDIMENAPLLLYLANSVIFALVGLLLGLLAYKGFLVPLLLGGYFLLFSTFQTAVLQLKLVIIYMILSYLFLFLGRFLKNSRADKTH